MTTKYLVISKHLIDDIPLGLHDRYLHALREAKENHTSGGPRTRYPFGDDEASEYLHTDIIGYDSVGRINGRETIVGGSGADTK
jgi:hypothetical protein